ncbi:AMP-binding protein [Oceanicola sp. D3]|uniref:long-chain-fatty-acid--CoA ligase n=1 Tax=Oceanicola sp. D3 TaxID=2587163 RepID=UPI001123150B|nr:long-chain-fatty-acid--CoA ligase [Oceanicola sp. D3]QDC10257.1 AMP-binding protein [Oceanicola sp. D3]
MAPFTRHLASWPKGVPHSIEIPARSMAQNLALTAEATPEAPAILYYGRHITYGALAAEVEALAGWLQSNGVAKGDRVLLYMQNAPQFIAGYYAILRADAVVVPVNPMNRAAELAYLCEDTGAEVALTGQELLPHLAGTPLRHILSAAYAEHTDPAFPFTLPEPLNAQPHPSDDPRVTPWSAAIAQGHQPGPITAAPDDLALIPYSSGTTGQPKGCMHSHRTVMSTCVGNTVWNPTRGNGTTLASLPLYHVTGMQNSMNAPILKGEPIILMTRWDRALAAYLIERYKVARWRSITTMAIDLVNDPALDSYDLTSLEVIGGGGASMPEAVAAKLKDLTGLDYIEGYGMTETMAPSHINPLDAPRRQCLGIPIFGVDSRVIDPETGAELGPNEPGEIIMHGPQNFLGYWNRPEETEAAHIEIDGKRFVRSGDIGRYDESGFFYIVDRVKRMVSVSGLKVWPTEVEGLMHAHPQITECCIIGRPDPRTGERVRAYIVPKGDVTAEEITTWCRANMAAYKVPKEIVFVQALPRSPSGKVQWRELMEEAAQEST